MRTKHRLLRDVPWRGGGRFKASSKVIHRSLGNIRKFGKEAGEQLVVPSVQGTSRLRE